MKAKDEIVNAIKGDKTLAKHIYKHTWISGSSTTIYPITLWLTDVCIQLDTHKNLFKKCIERILAKYPNLFKNGYFCKNDDSCPAEVKLIYTDKTMRRLQEEG